MGYVRETQEPFKELPLVKAGKKIEKKIDNILLNFNPEYKINIYQFILIKINDRINK